MQLREGEEILKVYHHHPTPFIYQVIKVCFAAAPFYVALFALRAAFSIKWYIIFHLILFLILCVLITYLALIYWLDRLYVTNQRVVYVDYKYLTIKDDSAVYLKDIQDIQTKEHGLLSYFKFFDYGTFSLDTASSYIALTFEDAPNPESIRQFIYHIKNS